MKRPSYSDAIAWIAANDDMYAAKDHDAALVSECLVADLFGVDTAKVRKDVGRAATLDGHPAWKREG